jgi:transcriptional regulator with XRE-family HTH domain
MGHSADRGDGLRVWRFRGVVRRLFGVFDGLRSNGLAALARGLSDLTVVSAADLAAARSWAEFGRLLGRLKTARGLSLSGIHRRAGQLRVARDLAPGTVSPVMNGGRPSREVLRCLLEVFEVAGADVVAWLEAWQRLAEMPSPGPRPRFDEMSPRQLGIHAAITADDCVEELPEYVARDFDDRLREHVFAGIEKGCFVLLVGRSSSGKTRSLYEAVHVVAPNWPIVQPAGTDEIVELLDGARQRIIVWLDEMHRFFGAVPPLTTELVNRLRRFPAIVVGTLWSDDYLERRMPRGPAARAGVENDRRLLDLAEVVSVSDVFSRREQAEAGRVARTDPRIRLALEVGDSGLTQVLAAGPDLLHRWEHAPDPCAKAVISFAADARRLGVLAPLTEQAFAAAVGGYLTSAQRVARPPQWLAGALAFGRQELHGAVSALTPVDDGQAGLLVGYVVADYLAQHIRRTDCPPRSAWEALISTTEDAEDLRRLAAAANARMRYRHEEQALRRLVERHGEGAVELASVLFRSGRDHEAIDLLQRRLTLVPDDRGAADRLDQFAALARRIEDRRAALTGDVGADRQVAEMFVDGGVADALRVKADAGSRLAEEDLAALLADRGAVDELRERADRGRQPAASALAELLATHGRADLLAQRADAGDRAAARQLAKLRDSAATADGAAVQAHLAHLRRRIGGGDEAAARQLTTLLFDLRNVTDLRREVDAGTREAAERLVALLNADESVARTLVEDLRVHGLDADGTPYPIGAA